MSLCNTRKFVNQKAALQWSNEQNLKKKNTSINYLKEMMSVCMDSILWSLYKVYKQ